MTQKEKAIEIAEKIIDALLDDGNCYLHSGKMLVQEHYENCKRIILAAMEEYKSLMYIEFQHPVPVDEETAEGWLAVIENLKIVETGKTKVEAFKELMKSVEVLFAYRAGVSPEELKSSPGELPTELDTIKLWMCSGRNISIAADSLIYIVTESNDNGDNYEETKSKVEQYICTEMFKDVTPKPTHSVDTDK